MATLLPCISVDRRILVDTEQDDVNSGWLWQSGCVGRASPKCHIDSGLNLGLAQLLCEPE